MKQKLKTAKLITFNIARQRPSYILAMALLGVAFGVSIGVLFDRYPAKDGGHIAAWAQAIGSIIAVGVAIYIPKKMKEDEINAEKLRHQERVQINLAMARRVAAYVNPLIGVAMNELQALDTPQGSITAKMMQEKINSALHVLQLSLDLHLLGEQAAIQVLNVIDTVLEMKVCIDTLVQDHPDREFRQVVVARFPTINQNFVNAWEKLNELIQ